MYECVILTEFAWESLYSEFMECRGKVGSYEMKDRI